MARNKSEVVTTGSPGSTVNLASSKSTGTSRPTEQKEKRSHTEVADSSIGDEFASIQKQLDQMSSEIQKNREDFKSLMNKEEMKTFIKNTIQNMTVTIQAKVEEALWKRMNNKIDNLLEETLEEKLEDKLEEKVNLKLAEVNDRMDTLTCENIKLREEVDNLKKKLGHTDTVAKTAAQKANTNEQYSRKNNVKIMGVIEEPDETEDTLTRKVQHILETKADVVLADSKIIALHRIPGKSGMPKPVLIKLRNNNEKTKIMKKRRDMKHAGYRLVDDVTKQNTKLINRLTLHKDIESAWYFNGNVFGKAKSGKHFKLEIYSDINEVLTGKKKDETGEGSADAEPIATYYN